MNIRPTKFMIDGIDRLGKSTLIENIQQALGYHLVIHYDKPKKLSTYVAQDSGDALRYYQEQANRGMFDLLKTSIPIIFDRTHLGELVYAPLYRKYSGEYVYEMEKDLIASKPYSHQDDIRFILLITSNFDMLEDDGLSFDFSKKADEQQMFINAFNKSNLVNKVIVDVHDGNGNYKSYSEVFEEALTKEPTK